MTGGGGEDRRHRGELVLDDVSQAPFPARPGIRHVDTLLVLGEPLAADSQLGRLDKDRGRRPAARRLGEKADHVFPQRGLGGAGPVVVEEPVASDSSETVRAHVPREIGAKDRRPVPQALVDVLRDRIVIGGNEVTGPVGHHLVLLDHHLRVPLGAVEPGDDPGVLLGEGDEITVVVVAHVLVVDAGQRRSLVLRSQVLPVVLDDHVHAVRVVAQHHHQNHVLKPGQNPRVLARRHFEGEEGQRLAGRNLAGVHRQGFHDEDPPVANELRALLCGDLRFEREPLVDIAKLLQPLEVVRRRDEGHVHRASERALSNLPHLDARRRGRELLQVIDELLVIHQLAVGAGHETDNRLRARGLGGRGLSSHRRDGQENCSQKKDSTQGSLHDLSLHGGIIVSVLQPGRVVSGMGMMSGDARHRADPRLLRRDDGGGRGHRLWFLASETGVRSSRASP